MPKNFILFQRINRVQEQSLPTVTSVRVLLDNRKELLTTHKTLTLSTSTQQRNFTLATAVQHVVGT